MSRKRRGLRRREMESRRANRRHAEMMRPCLRNPPMPCSCGVGDHTCGRYRTGPASLPAEIRHALKFGGGGFRPASQRRRKWERNKKRAR